MALVALAGSTVLLFLLILRASTLACLLCFTSPEERLQLCQIFEIATDFKMDQCKNLLKTAFQHLSDTEISEENFRPVAGPWGRAGEALSDSKKTD